MKPAFVEQDKNQSSGILGFSECEAGRVLTSELSRRSLTVSLVGWTLNCFLSSKHGPALHRLLSGFGQLRWPQILACGHRGRSMPGSAYDSAPFSCSMPDPGTVAIRRSSPCRIAFLLRCGRFFNRIPSSLGHPADHLLQRSNPIGLAAPGFSRFR